MMKLFASVLLVCVYGFGVLEPQYSDTKELSGEKLIEMQHQTTADGPCGCEINGIKFCNYNNGNTGFCEDCSNFGTVNDCDNDGLPLKGATDCRERCFSEGWSCGASYSGSTVGLPNVRGNSGGDYISSLSVDRPKNLTISSCHSGFDTYLRVLQDGTEICGCDDCGSCGYQTVLECPLPVAGTYEIVVEGYSSSEGDFEIEIACAEGCEDRVISQRIVDNAYNLPGTPIHGTKQECIDRCKTVETCVAFSWPRSVAPTSVGDCWLKSNNTANITHSAYDTVKVCRGCEDGVISQRIVDNAYNLPGTPIDGTQQECIDRCKTVETCVAFSWPRSVAPTSVGDCWLKSNNMASITHSAYDTVKVCRD